MKPRSIRRLVVAGLAAAAIALSIVGTMASSNASEIDWGSPAGQVSLR